MVNNFGSRILKLGMSGDDVQILQSLLNMLPASITGTDLSVDGDFGPKTQATVKMFQKYFGLTVDGIVGRNTFLYLGQPTGSNASGPIFGSRVLQKGVTGRDVWILQNRLASTSRSYANALGGPADSVFGTKTEAAVKLFQEDWNLKVDGVVGDQTLYSLYLHTFMGGRELRQSLQGLDVYFLQSKLKSEGFSPGALDGKFGPATTTAVKSLQTSAGISADGIVGPETFYHLGLKGA